MLTHPTLDQLHQLGLLCMASAFGDMTDVDAASLTHAEWLALLLEREISYRHDKRLAADCAMPDCDIRLLSRMSTIVLCEVSTGVCSRSWPLAPGSMRMTI